MGYIQKFVIHQYPRLHASCMYNVCSLIQEVKCMLYLVPAGDCNRKFAVNFKAL